MPNFEEIKRRAQDAAYTAAEKAQGAAAAAEGKAEAVREAAKVKVALAAERRSLAKNYQALGEWFAAQCGCDDVPQGAADILAAIRDSQDRLETLRAMQSEQNRNARELLDRGVDFFVGKAETLASLARRTAEGLRADDRAERFAEQAEELAEQAKTLAEDVVEAAADFINGENGEE